MTMITPSAQLTLTKGNKSWSSFMRDAMKVPFYFGGTSLLIVVVVIMDFMAQVQTLMMSSQYESALKKANLKGYGR